MPSSIHADFTHASSHLLFLQLLFPGVYTHFPFHPGLDALTASGHYSIIKILYGAKQGEKIESRSKKERRGELKNAFKRLKRRF